MFVVVFVALAVGLALLARRRRSKSTLAGLNVERPAYSLAPPSRWSTGGKDHRL